jgi:hypothetical protein
VKAGGRDGRGGGVLYCCINTKYATPPISVVSEIIKRIVYAFLFRCDAANNI